MEEETPRLHALIKHIFKLKSSRYLSALPNQNPNLSEGGKYLEQVRDYIRIVDK